MFATLGRLMVRYRWAVAGGWLVVVLLGASVGGGLFDRLVTTDGLRPDAESALAQRRLDRVAPDGPVVFGVVQGRDAYDPALVASVKKIAKDIRTIPDVHKVDDLYDGPGGRLGADNRSTLVRVELATGLPDDRRERAEDRVRAALKTIDAPTVEVGGDKLAERAFAEQSVSDLAVGESVAFALLIIALVVVFGGVIAAGLPLGVALAAVTGTLLGLLALTSVVDVSQYAVNVVSLLGIGLAVDYSLLIVARFREERAARGADAGGDGPVDAVVAATATAGRAVLVSGLAVAAALAGLAVFAEPLLASMALGGAVVVVLTTGAALTLVPALLAIAGRRIPPAGARTWVHRLLPRRAPGLRAAPRGGAALGRQGRGGAAPMPRGLLGRLAAFAQRTPGPVAFWAVVGLLLLAAPVLGANLQNSDARALPHSNEVRRAYDAFESGFNNNRAAPVTVVAEAGPGVPDVTAFLNRLNRLPEVARLDLRHDVAPGVTVVDLTPHGTTGGPPSRALVESVRGLPTPFAKQVTGEAAKVVDYRDSLAARLPVAAGVLLVATAVLLFALTGSLVVAVKALMLNVLTLAATLGVLVVAFQWGLAGPLLFFDPWGGLDLTTPVLLFVFVFGLSMDYEVFLLARIKEEYDRTGDNDRAVLAGITRSGPVVTAAAICVGIVFLGFAAGGLVAVKEIGVGMAVAILLDVTVIRGLLLPAAMTLLGEWNWWAPAPLRRLRTRLASRPPVAADVSG